MILSILIPTYNRSVFLIKNLELLLGFMNQSAFKEQIEVIVSNNCAPDDTDSVVKKYIEENPSFKLHYFKQANNIGLEKNALFVLEQSKAAYVMYLGDDDFISFEYLEGVLKHVSSYKKTTVIIPAFYNIDLSGARLGLGRDHNFPNKIFPKGFKSCFINSHRGHQMSGLVLKQDGLLKEYKEKEVQNIYLFIYFVAYNCLRGDTYHFPEFPVQVTNPGQQSKDWTYGEDGLLNNVFNNYAKLELTKVQITKLQLVFYKKQPWRLWNYKKLSTKKFMQAFVKIWLVTNGTFLFKITFPLQVIWLKLYAELKTMIK